MAKKKVVFKAHQVAEAFWVVLVEFGENEFRSYKRDYSRKSSAVRAARRLAKRWGGVYSAE